MKTAKVYKHKSGYWVAEVIDTGEYICGFHDTELEAYQAANYADYIVK